MATILLVSGLTPFYLQNCLTLFSSGIDIFFMIVILINCLWHRFNKIRWIRSSEILVYIDMIDHTVTAHSLRKSLIQQSITVPPLVKHVVLDWDLVIVEVIWVQWTRYQTAFNKPVWDDLSFEYVILLSVDIRRWLHCGHKQIGMVSNYVVFKRCSVGTNGPKTC